MSCLVNFYVVTPKKEWHDIMLSTEQKDRDSSEYPFALRKTNAFCNQLTNIYFNTSDSLIAEGINKVILRETFSGSGVFVVATNLSDVTVMRIVIEKANTEWTITFLY